MNQKSNKFQSLAPECLNENKKIYTEALDFALERNDIKNIAITGVYGAGKSSVLKTYVNEKSIENIITVTVGKYCGEKEYNKERNHVESQIINQISSYVEDSKIPLSKYRYKKNRTHNEKMYNSFLILMFVIGLGILFMHPELKCIWDEKFGELYVIGIFVMIVIPLINFIYSILTKYSMCLSKISIHGTSAELKKESNVEMSVLDMEIREIVYLLKSSEAEIVVFEDLDRYDEVEIFVKLREINFIVNSNRHTEKPIKFIYMVKDGLFNAEDRTKFFDFILPIVPVVDSKTSEYELVRLFEGFKRTPDKEVILNVSMYIDEMRILKNIINEYRVYVELLPMDTLELDNNKLFALMVVKNIFPKGYDNLQKNRGYIVNFFNKLKKLKVELIENRKKDVDCEEAFFKDGDIRKIASLSSPELIRWVEEDERESLFDKEGNAEEDNITKNHYFPLIRYLLAAGLIDDNYWLYIGNIEVNQKEELKTNDLIYIKNIKEMRENDPFLELESPESITARLVKMDYMKSNVLNKSLLEYLINTQSGSEIIWISDTCYRDQEIEKLVKVLEKYPIETIKIYVNILNKKNEGVLLRDIIDTSKNSFRKVYLNLLESLFTSKEINESDLCIYKEYIENEESVLLNIDDENLPVLEKNLNAIQVKFNDITDNQINEKIIKIIEKENLYKLNIKNVVFILNQIMKDTIEYGNLISTIYLDSRVESTRNYVEQNFVNFINEYIEAAEDNEKFYNEKEVLVKILRASIKTENKYKYLEKNEISLDELSSIEELEDFANLTHILMRKNQICCTSENISMYYNKEQIITTELITFMEENINYKNYNDVLESNINLCNALINNHQISDELFNYAVEFANNQIDEIDIDIVQNRISKIIDNNKLEINSFNVQFLVNKNFDQLILKLLDVDEDKTIDEINQYNLPDELYYKIINCNISENNSLRMYSHKGNDFKLNKLSPMKNHILEEIISLEISDENINYVCENFKKCPYKKEFLDVLYNLGKIKTIKNSELDDKIMEEILGNDDISDEIKVEAIIIKIENKSSVDEIEQYIGEIESVKNIANDLHKGLPEIIENPLQEALCEALKKTNTLKYNDEPKRKK